MIELQLPWPPTELSPNGRLHWAKAYKHKRAYREACWGTALAQKPGPVPDGPLLLELEFVPPSRRSYDRDNLVARMKSGLDGLADALKIDDKRFSTLAARLTTDSIGGFVRVRISKESS
jgi:crossover junction endodeoxyribonuclease RusA